MKSLLFIFYLAFVISITLGGYSIKRNKKAALNRVFSAMCFVIAIWAIGLAGANFAQQKENALMWWRISSLGWGVAYSVILHFTLLLTGYGYLIKKKMVLVGLYLPSVFVALSYGILGHIADMRYDLVRGTLGWVNIPMSSFYDVVFNTYYVTYAVVSLGLLVQWYVRSPKASKQKSHAKRLIITFTIPLVLGSFTDILANRFLTQKLPSLAPIFIILPMVSIYYIIRQNGILPLETKQNSQEAHNILNEDRMVRLFVFIGFVLIGGGLIHMVNIMMGYADLTSGLALNVLLTFMGLMIMMTPHLIKSVKLQVLILSVFLSMVMWAAMFAGDTLTYHNINWPIPLFFIMVSVVFNSKLMLYSMATNSLMIGIFALVFFERGMLTIGMREHAFRLMFYGIAVALTSFTTVQYQSKLKENQLQTQLQKIASDLTVLFLSVKVEDFEDSVDLFLKKCGEFVEADRAYIGFFSEDGQSLTVQNTWQNTLETPEKLKSNQMTETLFPWLFHQVKSGVIVHIMDKKQVNETALKEVDALKKQGIHSQVLIPLVSKGQVIGVMGLEQVNPHKKWTIANFELMTVLVNILTDAYNKLTSEKEINTLAYYDTLTKLPNRLMFQDQLTHAIELQKRHMGHVGVVLLDLDAFKTVNDTLGHTWGDCLLAEVATRLTANVRRYDTVSRFGGDEFLIMLPHVTDTAEILDVVKKLVALFVDPITVNQQAFYITASMGVSVYPFDGEDVNTLIKHADLAMYESKNNGKNRYTFCTRDLKERVNHKMHITNALYTALENKEITIAYQPQYSLTTRSITGFEALTRWHHPEYGLIEPEEFIPIAEQIGLIQAIGEWVLHEACSQNKSWQDQGYLPVQVAVNVSVDQFRQPVFVQTVKKCLDKTGLEPRYLTLEVTERIAMNASKEILSIMANIQALGVSVSIDDFGMEYSSLSKLKELPIDRLKINSKFVHGVTDNAKDASLVKVILHLAKSLDLRVIAKGVETKAQEVFLAKEGCTEAQGFLYHHAMSAEMAKKMLLIKP